MQKINIDYTKIYHSKVYGDYRILNEEEPANGTRQVRIKFADTGSERIISLGHACTGEVRDFYKRTVYGIGYLGDYIKNKYSSLLYNVWSSMICRCYNSKAPSFIGYGSIGVTVESSWLCFANFQVDSIYLYNYEKFINNPHNYQLDKDYLQQEIPKHQRIYSKNTCLFLSGVDNNNLHAIENNLLYQNTMLSKYIGVSKSRNNAATYEAVIRLNGKKYRIGTFTNEIAAANAYNYYFDKYVDYELVRIHNDVPYMSPEEYSQYFSKIVEPIKLVQNNI